MASYVEQVSYQLVCMTDCISIKYNACTPIISLNILPCPATGSSKKKCPGYVIDHVVSLACGGADAPENMHWQTVADAKEKDKWERKGCRRP